VSLFLEVEQTHVVNFVVEEGMKGVKNIDTLNKHYGEDALQRTQAYHWIREVKSGRKDLSHVPPQGRAPDEELDDCIVQTFTEDPHLSTKRIAMALNSSPTTVRNQLAKSLGMEWHHM
jgi:hypothetical protein